MPRVVVRLVLLCCLLLIAGTPLQNNMVELYGMLAFMYPDVFTTPGPFEAAFNLVKGTVSLLLDCQHSCICMLAGCKSVYVSLSCIWCAASACAT
jgi:hypothetical protein